MNEAIPTIYIDALFWVPLAFSGSAVIILVVMMIVQMLHNIAAITVNAHTNVVGATNA